MLQKRSLQDSGLRFFRSKKVVTLPELALHLECSARTVQRRLGEWEAINSYNRNGRYYTLPAIPEFDVNGLWRYREVFFSKFGNLSETLIGLVRNSPAGLTAAEVGELLGLRPSSFLWAFHDHPDLRREKHQGLYIYLASEPGTHIRQRQQRSTMSKTREQVSEFEAVAILVEKIKHPALSPKELSRKLRRKKLRVEPERIQDFFARHGLAGKKTPRST